MGEDREILSSVVVRKSIVSVGVDASTYRFIAFKDLLEIEGGTTVNEPGVVALEQAVGKATRELIIDGVRHGIWSFADPATRPRSGRTGPPSRETWPGSTRTGRAWRARSSRLATTLSAP